MANGDITVNIRISGTLSGGDEVQSFNESKVYSSIADYFDRILNVPTSEQTVLAIGTVAGATLAALNSLVIYNMDATNFVRVGLKDTGAKSAYFQIDAGEFFVLENDNLECDDDAGGAFASFNDIDTITLIADTAAVRCHVVAF